MFPRLSLRNDILVIGSIVKKHCKPRTAADKGGIIEVEAPIHVSNVKVLKEEKKEGKKASKKGNE